MVAYRVPKGTTFPGKVVGGSVPEETPRLTSREERQLLQRYLEEEAVKAVDFL